MTLLSVGFLPRLNVLQDSLSDLFSGKTYCFANLYQMNVDNYQSSQAVGYIDFRNMSDLFTSEHRFRKLCNTEYFFTVQGAASNIFSQFYLFQHQARIFLLVDLRTLLL